jgi:hypothetical protein
MFIHAKNITLITCYVCVYVCMYIYMYVYTYITYVDHDDRLHNAYMYIYIHVYTHTNMTCTSLKYIASSELEREDQRSPMISTASYAHVQLEKRTQTHKRTNRKIRTFQGNMVGKKNFATLLDENSSTDTCNQELRDFLGKYGIQVDLLQVRVNQNLVHSKTTVLGLFLIKEQ